MVASGRASGRKTLLQYSSLTPLERECCEGEVQPYRKTDYKPIIYVITIGFLICVLCKPSKLYLSMEEKVCFTCVYMCFICVLHVFICVLCVFYMCLFVFYMRLTCECFILYVFILMVC